jgi:hypothetical protein
MKEERQQQTLSLSLSHQSNGPYTYALKSLFFLLDRRMMGVARIMITAKLFHHKKKRKKEKKKDAPRSGARGIFFFFKDAAH